ncbi:hypothetical protein [Agrobacterium tumefaciens]|uniref:hypothetical protein n=1 Tax=Agrobacterium tumefaciens TaxID=358 RepID=UPI0021D23C4E|nr:hypothetical protein [Agrobacterium tumefaciens]UXS01121.1 hypothetical protein FY156_06260 [Agrobacterium tumefaciens]
MSKHSNFPRNKHDMYLTPYEAALPLRPFLEGVETFAEPCRADGRLIRWLESFDLSCVHSGDIQDGVDALTDPWLALAKADTIITNPPYTWEILEAMLVRFMKIAPTWLLLEADFAFNLQSAKFMPMCTDIVPIGRVRWFTETEHDSKDNFAWFRFHQQHRRGPVMHIMQLIDKRSIRKMKHPEIQYPEFERAA